CPGGPGVYSLDPEAVLELSGHPPADSQRRRRATQPHEVLAVGVTLDALELLNRDQRVAVDADEGRGELALEEAQRVLDQVLAVRVRDRGVLAVGEEVVPLLDGDELQSRPRARRDVRAARLAAGGREPLHLGARPPPG